MIVAVFRRRLKPGKSYEDFVEAWEAEQGFGVPTRVFTATSLEDPREVLTIGFVNIGIDDLAAGTASVAAAEAERHSKIDDVIESTELKGMYDLRSEHDFSGAPRRIPLASEESLLRALLEG